MSSLSGDTQSDPHILPGSSEADCVAHSVPNADRSDTGNDFLSPEFFKHGVRALQVPGISSHLVPTKGYALSGTVCRGQHRLARGPALAGTASTLILFDIKMVSQQAAFYVTGYTRFSVIAESAALLEEACPGVRELHTGSS